MKGCWQNLLLICVAFREFSDALRMLEVRVPNYTVKDNTIKLECQYDMEGERLYSVKWYKDGHEFYRYLPRDQPPATLFPQNGITVDLHNSSDTTVVLQWVNLSSSGRYRCEVSGEAPSFNTVDGYGDMTVVVLPENDPKISGGRAKYQIGDRVNVNCTSGRSKPAVNLTWFINGEHAKPEFVKHYKTIKVGREGLEQTKVGLRFQVKQKHFEHGDMKLKCLGVIQSVYWKSNEESAIGDRQKASMLEVKKPQSATSTSHTRADRVHANASNTLKLHFSLLALVIASISIILNDCVSQS